MCVVLSCILLKIDLQQISATIGQRDQARLLTKEHLTSTKEASRLD